MKIVCKKENDLKKMLALVKNLLESECEDYPILQDDLVLEFSLKDEEGCSCPKNDMVRYLEEKDLQGVTLEESTLEQYYHTDALTSLYNRGKYERDLVKFQKNGADGIACVYIDAVGLHEINNHLGHAAGDEMLRSIADGIRQCFPQARAYRIGGDEFVILSFQQTDVDTARAISTLKELLRQKDYEISVGVKINRDGATLMNTIDRAEGAMRYDKVQFYKNDGAHRQLRILNHKLERLLLEKQDASQFLNVIAPEYKGVYMVNPIRDTCRYIYIPEYFTKILANNRRVFSKAIREYCDSYVCEEDQAQLWEFLDYAAVLERIKQGDRIGCTYRKKDGSKVHLQITIYDPNATDGDEMLWIFMDGDRM